MSKISRDRIQKFLKSRIRALRAGHGVLLDESDLDWLDAILAALAERTGGPSQQESYPSDWKHCMIHLNPKTGEIHSDGDHSVRHWIEDRIKLADATKLMKTALDGPSEKERKEMRSHVGPGCIQQEHTRYPEECKICDKIRALILGSQGEAVTDIATWAERIHADANLGVMHVQHLLEEMIDQGNPAPGKEADDGKGKD